VKRDAGLEAAAFVNRDGSRVIILHRNKGDGPVIIAIDGERYAVPLATGSVATLRWSGQGRR
jgi:hypothetical protein